MQSVKIEALIMVFNSKSLFKKLMMILEINNIAIITVKVVPFVTVNQMQFFC